MKLWKISQSENDDYDTYDSAIVAAETEEEARKVYPRSDWPIPGWPEKAEGMYAADWVPSWHQVFAEEIGEAREGIKSGTVILASFNAG